VRWHLQAAAAAHRRLPREGVKGLGLGKEGMGRVGICWTGCQVEPVDGWAGRLYAPVNGWAGREEEPGDDRPRL